MGCELPDYRGNVMGLGEGLVRIERGLTIVSHGLAKWGADTENYSGEDILEARNEE